MYYEHLAAADVSRWFVDVISRQAQVLIHRDLSAADYAARAADTGHLAARSRVSAGLPGGHGISDINLIKPGTGGPPACCCAAPPGLSSCARVTPVKWPTCACWQKTSILPVVEDPSLPYQAVSLIKSSPMAKITTLGASLYVPATHKNLAQIASGDLRSVIFCTEDALNSSELPAALANLQAVLPPIAQ